MKPNWGKDYPITSVDILKRVYTQYPYFHRGLEVECKDGQRILTARKRGLRLFGYSTGEFKTAWHMLGIDPYCTKGENLKVLPYENNAFDLVVVPFVMEDINLHEIFRIGSRLIYLKLKPTKDWLKEVLSFPWKLEVYQKANTGNLIFECRK